MKKMHLIFLCIALLAIFIPLEIVISILKNGSVVIALFVVYFRMETYAETKIEDEFKKGQEAYDDKKYAEAIQIWRPLAEKGYPIEAGFIVKTWKSFFSKGYPLAQCKLGEMYEKGFGVVQDIEKAFHWYEQGAKQNHAQSQAGLGFIYRKKDEYSEALYWYRQAANQGNVSGQNGLGYMYRIKEDYKEAKKWYEKAADQGHAPALSNVGFMHSKGYATKSNPKEAVKWYRQSAKQGDEIGQHNLGCMYQEGKGVDLDNIQAYKWFYIADKNGSKNSKYMLVEVEKAMKKKDRTKGKIKTKKDIAEAIELANRCIESNYEDCGEPAE